MKIPKVSLKGFLLPIMLLSLKTSEAQSKYILRSSNFLIFRLLRSFLFICFKYATEWTLGKTCFLLLLCIPSI
jgi:hypothetical protein